MSMLWNRSSIAVRCDSLDIRGSGFKILDIIPDRQHDLITDLPLVNQRKSKKIQHLLNNKPCFSVS